MIRGTGIDIVEIERIGRVWARYGDKFIERLLTPPERHIWRQRGARLESLAGYWVAKEAVAKALGTGFSGFGFADVCVLHNAQGQPQIVLQDRALAVARQQGISRFWISISHSRAYVVAMAIGEGSC